MNAVIFVRAVDFVKTAQIFVKSVSRAVVNVEKSARIVDYVQSAVLQMV